MPPRIALFVCLVSCLLASWLACSDPAPPREPTPEPGAERSSDASAEPVAKDEAEPTDGQTPPEPTPDVAVPRPSHIQWEGNFTQQHGLLRLRDGALLLAIGIKDNARIGQFAINFPTTKAHCHLAKVMPDGRVQWIHYLFISSGSCHLRLWQLGDTVAVELPNVGLISPNRQKIQQPFPNQYESYIAQVSLSTGALLPQGVTFSGRVNVVRGEDDRLFIGGHCRKELFVAFGKAQARRAPKAKADQPIAKEGNACLAIVARKTEALQLWMLDGSATSGIDDIHLAADGSVYVVGGFGGYQQDLDATFDLGAPTQASLLNASADDDPAWDVYVARLDPQLRLKWAKAIMAYHNFVHRFGKLAPWKQGVVVYAHTDRAFSTWIDKGTADEQQIKGSALVAFEPTGKRAAIVRIEGLQELRPTKDGLLIWGSHPYQAAFGKDDERSLPSSKDLQRKEFHEVSYILQLDQDLAIKRFQLGGWTSTAARAALLSDNQIWLLLSATTFTVDEGLTTAASFGQSNASKLHLLPWTLTMPAP